MGLSKRTLWLLVILVLLALSYSALMADEQRVQPNKPADTPAEVTDTEALYGELEDDCNFALTKFTARAQTIARTVVTVAKTLVNAVRTVVIAVGMLVVRLVVTLFIIAGEWLVHAVLPV